jgi:plasmid rolling circle replication initiator protein Rep
MSHINWDYVADFPLSGSLGLNYPFLSEISPRDAIFNSRKKQAKNISKSLKFIDPDLSAQLSSCCSFLQFRYDEKLNIKLFRANFCRSRICPQCMGRKSAIWAAKALKGLPMLKTDYPGCRFLFLTLTIKNCQIHQLRATIKSLVNGWSKLTNDSRSFWIDWKWPALGYIKSVEVTRGSDGSAHPHLHALLLIPENYFSKHNYIQHHRWREIWQKAMMLNYEPFVNIQAVPIVSEHKSILEVVKYEIKIPDLTASARFTSQYVRECKRLKFFTSGGLLRQYFKFSEEEDLIHGLNKKRHFYDSTAAPDVSFVWNDQINQYTIE